MAIAAADDFWRVGASIRRRVSGTPHPGPASCARRVGFRRIGSNDPAPAESSFHVSSADIPTNNKEETISAAFSPDGSCVATGSWQGTVKIWDADTGMLLRSWKGMRPRKFRPSTTAPDGIRLLLVYSDARRMKLPSGGLSDGKELARWSGFPTGVALGALQPQRPASVLIVPAMKPVSGKQKVSGLKRRIGDCQPGRSHRVSAGHRKWRKRRPLQGTRGECHVLRNSTPTAARSSPPEKMGPCAVWNSGDRWQYGIVLSGHTSAVAEAAFSPDGRYVMTTFGLRAEVTGAVGGERSVRIWDKDTGKLLHTLKDDLGLKNDPPRRVFLQR